MFLEIHACYKPPFLALIIHRKLTCYCRDRVSSCNIYAVQQDTCWTAYILQDVTRLLQYQLLSLYTVFPLLTCCFQFERVALSKFSFVSFWRCKYILYQQLEDIIFAIIIKIIITCILLPVLQISLQYS